MYHTFTVGGEDYKLRLNARACVDLEKRLGTNPLNVLSGIASEGTLPELNTLITILHASLQPMNHSMNIDKVYDLYDKYVDEGNTLIDLVPVILEVFKVSGFFKEEDIDEKN